MVSVAVRAVVPVAVVPVLASVSLVIVTAVVPVLTVESVVPTEVVGAAVDIVPLFDAVPLSLSVPLLPPVGVVLEPVTVRSAVPWVIVDELLAEVPPESPQPASPSATGTTSHRLLANFEVIPAMMRKTPQIRHSATRGFSRS
jgi:hypothetical protein